MLGNVLDSHSICLVLPTGNVWFHGEGSFLLLRDEAMFLLMSVEGTLGGVTEVGVDTSEEKRLFFVLSSLCWGEG